MHRAQRKGAGRPVGTGKFKTPTQTIRIPVNWKNDIELFLNTHCHRLPLVANPVQAGYPAPAGDETEPEYVSVMEKFVREPKDTFLFKASGDSMVGAGIYPGDTLVVDRGVEARDGSIVIACIDNEFTVKRLKREKGKLYLMPENAAYRPIPVGEGNELLIWGVVRYCIHEVR